MKRQISFMHDGVKLFSVHGSSYFQNDFPDTNVVNQQTLFSKASYQQEFVMINNGKNFKAALFVENPTVLRTGNFYDVTGTVNIDGEDYDVHLTREDLTFAKIVKEVEPMPDIEPVEEEDIVEEIIEIEPVQEQESENVPEHEPMPDIEPVEEAELIEEIVEFEQEPEPAAAPDPEPVVVTEPKPVVVTEPKPAPKVERAKAITLPTGRTTGPGLSIGSNKQKALPPSMSESKIHTHRIEFKEKDIPKRGITFGQRQSNSEESLPMGIQESSRAGISFGKREVPRSNAKRIIRNENLRQQAIQAQAAKEAEEELNTERLQKAWNKPMSLKQKYESIAAPEPVAFEEPVVEEPVNTFEPIKTPREEAKLQVRKDLPEDINKVIGDIPIDLLGSIAEFTMNPINTVELINGKDMYCIDRRWHKQGKWFCIDVVSNSSRHFFNSRLGVNIEIPVNTLKAWKEALST